MAHDCESDFEYATRLHCELNGIVESSFAGAMTLARMPINNLQDAIVIDSDEEDDQKFNPVVVKPPSNSLGEVSCENQQGITVNNWLCLSYPHLTTIHFR